jgi:hypothetical protein
MTVMEMDAFAEHEARLRGSRLVALINLWGDAYTITWDRGVFTARRKSGSGQPLTSTSDLGLHLALCLDYARVRFLRESRHSP